MICWITFALPTSLLFFQSESRSRFSRVDYVSNGYVWQILSFSLTIFFTYKIHHAAWCPTGRWNQKLFQWRVWFVHQGKMCLTWQGSQSGHVFIQSVINFSFLVVCNEPVLWDQRTYSFYGFWEESPVSGEEASTELMVLSVLWLYITRFYVVYT